MNKEGNRFYYIKVAVSAETEGLKATFHLMGDTYSNRKHFCKGLGDFRPDTIKKDLQLDSESRLG